MSNDAQENLRTRVSHVFVDFENVPQMDPAVIGRKSVCFTLLLGALQTRLDVELVKKLMKHAASVELIRLTSSGKDALDLTLAYYVGRAAVIDPAGAFHIVSKDTGYDPLIEHLKSRGIQAKRHCDFTTLSFAAAEKPFDVTPADRLTWVLECLRKIPGNRPRNRKKLSNSIFHMLGKTATETELTELIELLRRRNHVSFNVQDIVTYHL